jgi:hypothetical protein
VGDLFEVKQGALTGRNEAFVLSSEEFYRLPEREHRFFRVAASTRTIRRGTIIEKEYVFFPYAENGDAIFNSRSEVIENVPHYFSSKLEPQFEFLRARADFDSRWWMLTRPRDISDQNHPKIVSAYFGGQGNFAYDFRGNVVSLHGYMWLWKGGSLDLAESDLSNEDSSASFDDSILPWAYVAILNSLPFEKLLSCFCARVQGGQFNLSKRYVSDIPIPDLLSNVVPGDITNQLAKIGQDFYASTKYGSSNLNSLVARAYGVQLDEWPK